jgi:hypothetical protein
MHSTSDGFEVAGVERGKTLRLVQVCGLGLVDDALLELEQAADMVIVGVGGDHHERLVEQRTRRLLEAHDAEAAVDQQVAVRAAHVPDVAAEQGIHVGLPDPRNVLVHAGEFEPAAADLERHDGLCLVRRLPGPRSIAKAAGESGRMPGQGRAAAPCHPGSGDVSNLS